MKSWIFWNLTPGTDIPEYEGVVPGQEVDIHGWRFPGSVDRRRVVSLIRAHCQRGVMVVIDRPLHNQDPRVGYCPVRGRTWVSIGWLDRWEGI